MSEGYLDSATVGVSVLDGSELRESKTGTPYVRVGIRHGDVTVWATIFGEPARDIAGTIAKGDRVYAEGQLEVRLRERDGRYKAEITMIARRLERLSNIGDRHEGNEKRARPKQRRDGRPYEFRPRPKPQKPTKAKQGLYAPIADKPFDDELPEGMR